MKTIVVLPAYNCSKTLRQTVVEIPSNIVDEIILVDDCSQDKTCFLAKELGITHIFININAILDMGRTKSLVMIKHYHLMQTL